MPLFVAIVVSIFIQGCSNTSQVSTVKNAPTQEVSTEAVTITTTAASTQETKQYCDQYYAAVKILDDTKQTLLKQYGEDYTKSEEWKAFEKSYWEGFWKAHKDCKICNH